MMPCAPRRCLTFKDTRPPVAVVFDNMEDGMTIDEASIEVDKHTADALQMRAAELGVAVPQLIAELATLDSDPRHAGLDEVAELDRRYARATEGSRVPGERASTTV